MVGSNDIDFTQFTMRFIESHFISILSCDSIGLGKVGSSSETSETLSVFIRSYSFKANQWEKMPPPICMRLSLEEEILDGVSDPMLG